MILVKHCPQAQMSKCPQERMFQPVLRRNACLKLVLRKGNSNVKKKRNLSSGTKSVLRNEHFFKKSNLSSGIKHFFKKVKLVLRNKKCPHISKKSNLSSGTKSEHQDRTKSVLRNNRKWQRYKGHWKILANSKKSVLRIIRRRGNVQKNKSIEQRLNLSRS